MASFIWVIVLTVIASASSLTPDLLPALWQRLLVCAAIVLTGIGATLALARERREQQAASKRRDDAEQASQDTQRARHDTLLAQYQNLHGELVRIRESLPPQSPVVAQLQHAEESVRVSLAAMAPPRVIVAHPSATIIESRTKIVGD